MRFFKFDKEKILEKLRNKYRLTIHNESTLHEVMNFNLTRMNLFTYAGVLVILIGVVEMLLLIFTPLNALLPAYTDTKLKRQLVENVLRVDSLEKELKMREQYYLNIRKLMQGEELDNFETVQDTSHKYNKITFTKTEHDSVLRKLIEEQEQSDLAKIDNKQTKTNISNLHFYLPVKGLITNKFEPKENHFGIDIVGEATAPIMATLDGTVVMATWSLSTGWVIQVQHDNNLISIYKHNSALLKKEGDHVKAGETIAIIGNSGELTTGPHLHFELWYKGTPVNPENYIPY